MSAKDSAIVIREFPYCYSKTIVEQTKPEKSNREQINNSHRMSADIEIMRSEVSGKDTDEQRNHLTAVRSVNIAVNYKRLKSLASCFTDEFLQSIPFDMNAAESASTGL